MEHLDPSLNYMGDVSVDEFDMFFSDDAVISESADHEDDYYFSLQNRNDFYSEETSNAHDNFSNHNCNLAPVQDSSQIQFINSTPPPINNQEVINCQVMSSFSSRISKDLNKISQSEFVEGLSSGASTSSCSMRKLNLSHQQNEFKKLFYQVFTSKKRIPKEIVKKIHNIILVPLELKKMSREEFRKIDLYFQNYLKYSTQILIYLQKHKEDILGAIPELLKY